jgi:outer membrane receptor protein involved in Fe transport
MNTGMRLRRALIGASLTVMFGALAAHAADPATENGAAASSKPTEVGAVVVTARLRKELVSQTPAVVTAVTGDTLAQSGITDLSHIDLLVPNVNVSTGFLLDSLHVRGIGSNASNPGSEQQVGLYVDGVYYGNGHWISGALLDVDTAEILKGPQGVYLGQNSIAGAFNITTKDPGSVYEGYVKAGYEFVAAERYVEGAVSVPITDTLSARLAVHATQMDGWMTQSVTGEKLPGIEDLTSRATLAWRPTSNFKASLKFSTNNYTDKGAASTTALLYCGGPNNTPGPLVGWGSYGGAAPCVREFQTGVGEYFGDYFGGVHSFDRIYNYAATLNLHWSQSFGELTSTTAWNEFRVNSYLMAGIATFDSLGNGVIPAIDDTSNQTFSEELRYQTKFDFPVNFLFGGYYQKTKFFAHDSFLIYSQAFEGDTGEGGPLPPQDWSTQWVAHQPGSNLAFYGEAQWVIARGLELDASARWTEARKHLLWNNTGCGGFFCSVVPLGTITDKLVEDNLSPQVTLRWQPIPDFMAYASYRSGFLEGGWNAVGFLFAGNGPDGLEPASSVRYGDEKARGGEVGAKFYLLNRHLYLDVDSYYYVYKGLQVSVYNPVTSGFGIENAGESINDGVEFNAHWIAGHGFDFTADVAYNNSYYQNYIGSCLSDVVTQAQGCNVPTSTPGVFAENFTGEHTDFAPFWAGRVATDYTHKFDSGWVLRAGAGLSFTGRYLVTQYPIQPGFVKVDAQVAVDRGPWTASLVGQNLNNQFDCTSSSGRPVAVDPSELQCVVERGREVRLELTRRF